MNTENNLPQNDQEIDLGVLFKKVSIIINTFIIKVFSFFKSNGKTLLFIFLIGTVIGFLLDAKLKSYVSEIIVNTNHTGNEYLYSKVKQLNSQIQLKENNFENKINYDNFSKIEIEPIIDIYNFVNNQALANNAQNSQNFEMIKLLSENSDINKVIKDEITSKNFYFQKINIYSAKKISYKETKSILNFLNKDVYFDSIKNLKLENINRRIIENDSIIKQIDLLITSYKNSLERNSNSLIKSENSEIGQLISQKRDLLNQIAQDRLDLISQTKLIKDNTIVLNSINNKGLANKSKLIVPLFLLFIFFIYKIMLNLNNRLKSISK